MMTKQTKVIVEGITRTPEFIMINWKRFNSNKAWIGKFSERYDLIKSYSTIVGLVDKEERVFYELGKWSQTTTRQINKIHKDIYTYYDFVKA